MKLIIIKYNIGNGSQIIGHAEFAEQVIPKLKAAGYCCVNSQNELGNYIASIFNNKPNQLPGMHLKCISGNPLLYLLDELQGCTSVIDYQEIIHKKWKNYNSWYDGIKLKRAKKLSTLEKLELWEQGYGFCSDWEEDHPFTSLEEVIKDEGGRENYLANKFLYWLGEDGEEMDFEFELNQRVANLIDLLKRNEDTPR